MMIDDRQREWYQAGDVLMYGPRRPPLRPGVALAIVLCCLFALLFSMGGAAEPAVDPLLAVGTPDPGVLTGPFAVSVDGNTRNPAWVLEYLHSDRVPIYGERAERSNAFHGDDRIPAAWRATTTDYKGSPFHRGHCAAAGNYRKQAEQDATFALSNMLPEAPGLNMGTMKKVEAEVLAIAKQQTGVHVYTLPIYKPVNGKLKVEVIGPRGVWVPTHVGKAVLVWRGAKPERMKAWIMPNVDDCPPPEACVVSVDALESASGKDLFNGLDDSIEDKLEASP